MSDFHPVTNAEWEWLTRRFVALERLPGMRALFDRSLPGSPYTTAERRQYRREIFKAVKQLTAPTEAYPNPYFELQWVRSVQANPELLDNLAYNRSILWDAFFKPAEPAGIKERRISEWDAIRGSAAEVDSVVVTDGELEEAE